MIVLNAQHVTKRFGPDPVLDRVSFDVRQGEHVALVGANGAGKTTLLDILRGALESDSGSVEIRANSRVGFIAQHPEDSDQSILEVARQGLRELTCLVERSHQLAEQMSRTQDVRELERIGERFDQVNQHIETRGGFQIEHRIHEVLSGVGFAEESFDQPVRQLSGGQLRRVMLARLLLESPDLMLLDEPSNHLDIESTEWLEGFLIESPQAFLIVSHDRFLLDRVTTRTLELVHAKIDSFPGNFTKYQQLKVERLDVERKTFQRQQAEIEKLKDFVRRHHHGQKHAQAEDRRKKLERIELVPLPREIEAPPMAFPQVERAGDIVARAVNISKGYDQPLFDGLSFDILRGERWGIVGPNGCGKTTLLRCLIGEERLDQGAVTHGANVKIGYFDQKLDFADNSILAVDAIRPSHKEFIEQQRRDLLARFGIVGDMVFQNIGSLSGGERNRVGLARLAAADANVLILDEPTNHLDLWARGALEKALVKYKGTLLFVSHDRYFINRVADHIIYCAPDRFRVVDGNYSTLRYLLSVERQLATTMATAASNSRDKTKQNDADANSQLPRWRFPFRKLTDLEHDIHQCESRIAALHEELADPDVLRDRERVVGAKQKLVAENRSLQRLYEHWEEALVRNQS